VFPISNDIRFGLLANPTVLGPVLILDIYYYTNNKSKLCLSSLGMDVLCTDKTGTLTENQVVLMRHVDYFCKTSAFPLQLAFLNSYFQTGLKNLLDVAIIEYVEKSNVISSQPNRSERVKSLIAFQFNKVHEIPFDFVRRRMSVLLQSRNNCLLISKGAVDEMIDICSHIYLEDNIIIPSFSKEILSMGTKNDLESKVEINDLKIPEEKNVLKLTPVMISNLKHMNDLLNGDGIRVVAVAYKKFNEMPNEFQRSDEKDLIFAGFVGFLDPPKESALPAINFLREHNVNVKVLTGNQRNCF
jgi:Mg2+-importing ATPase